MYDPAHPLGCHRRRIPDRLVFDKLIQVDPADGGVVLDAEQHESTAILGGERRDGLHHLASLRTRGHLALELRALPLTAADQLGRFGASEMSHFMKTTHGWWPSLL